MARPHIIRADTIDLQDRKTPSAKDHSHSHAKGPSPLAPHQAGTLREVAQETAEENARSPRVSWSNGDAIGDLQQHAEDISAGASNTHDPNGSHKDRDLAASEATMQQQQRDSLAVAQNGGLSGNIDESDADGDTDDSLEDDLMDKISSSPSIEDDSLPTTRACFSPTRSPALGDPRSSSPYLEIPEHPPMNSIHPRQHSKASVELSPRHATDDEHERERERERARDEHEHDECSNNETADTLDDTLPSDTNVGLDAAETHGTFEVRPLNIIKIRDSRHRDFAARRAEMEKTERVKAVGQFVDENDENDDPLTMLYEASLEDDDDFTAPLLDDPKPNCVNAAWADKCLHRTEDIDFDFVYALHTFVATVEGQANATKGDTMVLLDDSNSYWWLVRVVKDSSIGYLPAEHIETPTERLARLNKHRNIDLSATMLGDQPGEKSKSTFRSALRGKKRKTVVFAEPTYVNYSDLDYSSEEEDVDELFGTQKQTGDQGQAPTDSETNGDAHVDAQDEQHPQQEEDDRHGAAEQTQRPTEDAMIDETARVEPLKPRATKEAVATAELSKEVADEQGDNRPSSEQFFETKSEGGPSRSRNGTVRNTDSFFKDETVETKKITLTPNLLRDDNTTPRPSSSNDSKDLKQRPSLDKMDKMEKELQPDKKEDRKKKDKKPSVIRSFFSRKDKKKATDDDDDSFGKRSMDAENEHDDDRSDVHASPEKPGPQRQPSKLQKQQPRTEPSPTRRPGSAAQKSTTRELADYIVSEARNDVSNVPPASMRIVQEQQQERDHSPANGQRGQGQPGEQARPGSSQKEERSGLSKIKLSRSAGGGAEKQNKVEKPQKVTKAKSRIELDDFDSTDEETTAIANTQHTQNQAQIQTQTQDQSTQEKAQRPVLPGAYPDSFASNKQADGSAPAAAAAATATATATNTSESEPPAEHFTESPVQVSSLAPNDPPALMGDTSSQEDSSSKSPSPELVDTDEAAKHTQDSMTSSTSTSNSRGSSWNDAKLRAFFDSGSDIRDMLVVVYDKSDVVPAGPDHPLLAEITTQLDNMLGDWLARKQRLRGTV
ncbi:hypothetical protein SODALDRAFT_335943 [Sodiomyces alkalinus F11]|uniref:SH3 domain-containing protein n=1 Tax=Sodiomyces alkalinus (strain CBS 110278 / VKM F-3762 / F11) TaxID=1314773 RepID=A0A3N2Q5N9_SODAK|nr:hypothetical protein SODALDRAFT_335943 [Sodiomyces alkalinus F11]ROT42094.1 hypothetical protein SODALDRAFT_335943 [Sodiomyces alkalinus F11]